MEGAQAAVAPATTAEFDLILREQLVDRRERLELVQARSGPNPDLGRLLDEVDAALQRFEAGTYGLCEVCHDSIEPERLMADPLVRVCLGDLTDKQRHSLEGDLELAAEIQTRLLPQLALASHFAQVDFIYQPAGIVSGDYCDVIAHDGSLFFLLGDVSGKGVAASLLMSNLHGMFRLLVPLGLPLHELMDRANRLFCENTLANQYATLVFGKIDQSGEVEMYNAGHLPPIVVSNGESRAIDGTGMPLGMFNESCFDASRVKLAPGDGLLLYSDGVTETTDRAGNEYGFDRLLASVKVAFDQEPALMLRKCLADVDGFRAGGAKSDDLTILALKYAG
jgi:sigma-B regulation protein RsbU (phosphoserine phosphatase)